MLSKNQIKKDLMHFYMFRNAFISGFGAYFAFSYSLMRYYDCGSIEAFRRVFFNDFFTFTYFLLIWAFDYLVFEASKIFYDSLKLQLRYVFFVVCMILMVLVLFIDIRDIFVYNGFILMAIVILRMVKQYLKKSLKKGLKQ